MTVIHGVGTRDRQSFEDRVARLQVATGGRHEMRPVYWGDLGADDRRVHLTIPSPAEPSGPEASGSSEIRGGTAPPGIIGRTAELAAALGAGFPVAEDPMTRDLAGSGGARLAAAGAVKLLGRPPDNAVDMREGDPVSPAQAVVTEAITERWESTTWLRQVTDPLLLEEIGGAIGAALAGSDAAAAPPGEELRGAKSGPST